MKPEKKGIHYIGELQATLEKLLEETKSPDLSTSARKNLENRIREVIKFLGDVLIELDPIKQPSTLFDPSDPQTVARFVSLALVAQPRVKMGSLQKFYGAGVYAIYYNGGHPLYAPISGSETPIYVGKAAPSSSHAKSPFDQGDKLSGRLLEHSKNIAKATTSLSLDDFECRALVVQSGWENAAENYLIKLFKPIWNNETNLVFGLGKHGDSAETRANKRSPWDTVHPGRTWAAHKNLSDAKTLVQIESELETHFHNNAIFRNIDELLHSFLEGLNQR